MVVIVSGKQHLFDSAGDSNAGALRSEGFQDQEFAKGLAEYHSMCALRFIV